MQRLEFINQRSAGIYQFMVRSKGDLNTNVEKIKCELIVRMQKKKIYIYIYTQPMCEAFKKAQDCDRFHHPT